MKQRYASCHCGKAEVHCTGEPEMVIMCHCQECQKRTGSTYNLGAWFRNDKISFSRDVVSFARTGEKGSTTTFRFCPTCGSNLFWETSTLNGMTAVAVGCFADPDFPQPTMSFFGHRRHTWVNVPDGISRDSSDGGT